MKLLPLDQRTLKRNLKDYTSISKKQLKRLLKNPKLALLYRRYRSAVVHKDWRSVRDQLPPLYKAAYETRDTRLIAELSHASERFGDYEQGTSWAFANAQLQNRLNKTYWLGEEISNSTLIISFRETEKQGISTGLQLTGYVKRAS